MLISGASQGAAKRRNQRDYPQPTKCRKGNNNGGRHIRMGPPQNGHFSNDWSRRLFGASDAFAEKPAGLGWYKSAITVAPLRAIVGWYSLYRLQTQAAKRAARVGQSVR